MMLNNITKIHEGLYSATSPECPRCGGVLTVELTGPSLFLYNQGALVQQVLPNLSLDDRERFVSGYCPTCWTDLFGDDEEDDDEYEEEDD